MAATAVLRGGGVEAHRLQLARDVGARDEAQHRGALGLRRSDACRIGADHSGLRHLIRRPDHQHDQQAADCSCPSGLHFYS
jgi:hypothetical protein